MHSVVNVFIDLTDPGSQEFEVTINWNPKSLHQEFLIPIWTPGSYKVRDHAQFLYNLKLKQGHKKVLLERMETNRI